MYYKHLVVYFFYESIDKNQTKHKNNKYYWKFLSTKIKYNYIKVVSNKKRTV